MKDLWYDIIPLALIACLAFFIYGLGQVIFDYAEKRHLRFEMCIAADKQWAQGSCVK